MAEGNVLHPGRCLFQLFFPVFPIRLLFQEDLDVPPPPAVFCSQGSHVGLILSGEESLLIGQYLFRALPFFFIGTNGSGHFFFVPCPFVPAPAFCEVFEPFGQRLFFQGLSPFIVIFHQFFPLLIGCLVPGIPGAV